MFLSFKGYGHSVPKTALGKILCICYAIFGVPLWLVTFQAMGERFNTGAKYLFKVVGHKMGKKFEEVIAYLKIVFLYTSVLNTTISS